MWFISPLTTSADTATAALFNGALSTTILGAQIQTLQSVDTLTGTAGTADTLNAQINGSESITAPTMSGVEIVNLTGIDTGGIVDFSNVTGVTKLNVANSQATATTSADLTVQSIAALADVSFTGAYAVAGTANAADLSLKFANSVVSGATDSLNVAVGNDGRGVTASGTTFSAFNAAGDSGGGFETINVTSTGGASRFSSFGSSVGAANYMKTLNVAGDSNLRIDNVLSSTTTVDANAFTGNLSVTLDPTVAVAVTGGTGNDSFTFGAGLTNSDKVDGGAGRDTLSVSNLTGLGSGNQISNMEILKVTGSVAGTVNFSDLGSNFDAIVDNTTGAMIYKNSSAAGSADATKGLTILNTGSVNDQVKGATLVTSTADSLAVNIGATGDGSALNTGTTQVSAGNLTADGIETLSMSVIANAAGTTSSGIGAVTDADLQTLNITGGSVGQAFAVGTIDATATNLTKIDGSTYAGNLSIAGNAVGQAITGGAGSDTLYTGGRGVATTNGDVLDGGAGNDVLGIAASDSTATLANAAVSTTFTATQVGLFTSIDELDLGGATASSTADTLDFRAVGITNAATVVNAGAATALTGATFQDAVDGVLSKTTANGGLVTGASGEAAGLYTWGGQTFLVGTTGTAGAHSYTQGTDTVVCVTGYTGTLSSDDFVGGAGGGGGGGGGGGQTTLNVDAVGGTYPTDQKTLTDLSTGSFNLTDSVTLPEYVKGSNYGADDNITYSGVTEATFAASALFSTDATGDVTITYTNPTGAMPASVIELDGIAGTSLVSTYAQFQALAVGDIKFA